jgi:hypothetical protein
VTGYTMLFLKRHYHELGASFFDTLSQAQIKKSCLKRLDKLGYEITLRPKPGTAPNG